MISFDLKNKCLINYYTQKNKIYMHDKKKHFFYILLTIKKKSIFQ